MALILARCSCDKPTSFPCRSNLWSEWPTKSCTALPWCPGCPPRIILWLGSSARTSVGTQTIHVSKAPRARMTENRELITLVVLDILPSLCESRTLQAVVPGPPSLSVRHDRDRKVTFFQLKLQGDANLSGRLQALRLFAVSSRFIGGIRPDELRV